MHNTKRITKDLYWVGANDRRLAMFEGVYDVPTGVSYNSYLLLDDEVVLFDTVDKAVSELFFENIEFLLQDRTIDYLVVHHMEPDHSATLKEVVRRYPNVTIICNAKIKKMIEQYFVLPKETKYLIVDEGQTFKTRHHKYLFINAPMVHWPEVMMSYDLIDQILFSADAFGTFGALNGAIYADEVDFYRDYIDEARRYYTNIVGKYGPQVQAVLKKAATIDIKMICPLHGPVWRKNASEFIELYNKWSSYTPEEEGVLIAYASVYGHTENAAEILSSNLRDLGVKTKMFDVSVTDSSYIVSEAFRYSHLVFASTTYNAGIFIKMDELLRDLSAHNIQNRTVAFIENGSWAPTAKSLMKEILSKNKNLKYIEKEITVASSLKEEQLNDIFELATEIKASFPQKKLKAFDDVKLDNDALFKLSYGLYVLTAKEGSKDNGCIVNTVQLLTDTPKQISFSINKMNLTHDMVLNTKEVNVSILNTDANFDVFKKYGFVSGRETSKFSDKEYDRATNGIVYVRENANAYISARVVKSIDCGTHTLFIAEVDEAKIFNEVPSMTYQYYFDHVKPKPIATSEDKGGYVCKICGYVYEGDELPSDYVCPLCKHGPQDFEKI